MRLNSDLLGAFLIHSFNMIYLPLLDLLTVFNIVALVKILPNKASLLQNRYQASN